MKIIFWNTARGKNRYSERFEYLMENVFALSCRNPEVILLCEALKGTQKVMRNSELYGYKVVKPSKLLGGYADENVLRYIVLCRNDLDYWASLISTENKRPAILIHAGKYNLLGIHAPSVTKSYVPQSRALKKSFRNILNHHQPQVIFGDFNVDAFNGRLSWKFITELEWEYNQQFNSSPSKSTIKLKKVYDNKFYTRPSSNKTLDWALVPQYMSSKVSVKVVRSSSTYDSEDSDEDFVPEIISTVKSDHEAIEITIS